MGGCPELPIEIWTELVFPLLHPARRVLARSVCRSWRTAIPPDPAAARRAASVFARSGDLPCLQWVAVRNPAALRASYRHVPEGNGCGEDFLHEFVSTILPSIVWQPPLPKRASESFLCWKAARGGHVEVLKWLRERGCAWDASTCSAAARGGHLDALKWLRRRRCPFPSGSCTNSVCRKTEGAEGHAEMLMRLWGGGCPWDDESCRLAAEGGHLDLLKWLRANGCPWGAGACSAAAQGGSRRVP